jgi:hypothetical protein
MDASGLRYAGGMVAAQRRGTTLRRHPELNLAWDASQVPLMTEAEFRNQLQPSLDAVATRAIAEVMQVPRPYAKEIQTGKRLPHPRHWVTLRDLAVNAQSQRETTEKPNE